LLPNQQVGPTTHTNLRLESVQLIKNAVSSFSIHKINFRDYLEVTSSNKWNLDKERYMEHMFQNNFLLKVQQTVSMTLQGY